MTDAAQPNQYPPWTREDIRQLRRFYYDKAPTKVIAAALDRTGNAIGAKARTLGLIRQPNKRKRCAAPRSEYVKPEVAAAKAKRERIDCIRCGRRFDTWDRVRNRMCKPCRNKGEGSDFALRY